MRQFCAVLACLALLGGCAALSEALYQQPMVEGEGVALTPEAEAALEAGGKVVETVTGGTVPSWVVAAGLGGLLLAGGGIWAARKKKEKEA